MTKETYTSAEVRQLTRYMTPGGGGIEAHPSGLLYRRDEVDRTINALAAERNEWKARAERAEAIRADCVLSHLARQLRQSGYLVPVDVLSRSWQEANRVTLAQIGVDPAEPGPTLADAYSAGLVAAADKAESMPTGIYPKDVAKVIRALEVPNDFGGE